LGGSECFLTAGALFERAAAESNCLRGGISKREVSPDARQEALGRGPHLQSKKRKKASEAKSSGGARGKGFPAAQRIKEKGEELSVERRKKREGRKRTAQDWEKKPSIQEWNNRSCRGKDGGFQGGSRSLRLKKHGREKSCYNSIRKSPASQQPKLLQKERCLLASERVGGQRD